MMLRITDFSGISLVLLFLIAVFYAIVAIIYSRRQARLLELSDRRNILSLLDERGDHTEEEIYEDLFCEDRIKLPKFAFRNLIERMCKEGLIRKEEPFLTITFEGSLLLDPEPHRVPA